MFVMFKNVGGKSICMVVDAESISMGVDIEV